MNNRPKYVDMSIVDRQRYLASIISFANHENNLFEQLCVAWQPEIPFHAFVESLDSQVGIETTLEKIFTKLLNRGLGLILYSQTADKQIYPSAFILTDRLSLSFHAYFISNFYVLQQLEKSPKYLKVETFEEIFLQARLKNIKEIDFKTFTSPSASTLRQQREPVIVTFDQKKQVYLTGNSLESVCHIALRYFLNTLEANYGSLASAANLTTEDLQKLDQRISPSNIHYWVVAVEKVQAQFLHIVARLKAQESVDLDITMVILEFYLSSLKQQEAEEVERKSRLRDAFSDLITEFEHLMGFMSEEKFIETIEYTKEWISNPIEVFSEEFERAPTGSLPLVIKFGKSRIYRDNIIPLFLDEMEKAREYLYKYYKEKNREEMSWIAPADHILFSSMDNLDSILKKFIEQHYPILNHLLAYPNNILKIFLFKTKETPSMREDYLRIMKTYFIQIPGKKNIILKPHYFLFDLQFDKIFSDAFFSIPLWQRYLLKITGRYKILYSRMIDNLEKL